MHRNHYVLKKKLARDEFSEALRRLSGSILVIDSDGEGLVRQIRDAFESCTIIHQKNLDEAYQSFLKTNFDLVLLDHSPRCHCFELLSRFKTSRPGVPILIMTAFGSESLATEAFRQGARDYLKKPLELDELVPIFKAVLTMRKGRGDKNEDFSSNGVEKSVRFIRENFKSHISLHQASQRAGMSVSTFIRCFKSRTGMTFVEYVNSVRIANACQLLKENRLSLLEIALSSGFSNQVHFSRTFKRLLGICPREYQKKSAIK